jgi:long-chain acyl-CoA synthetase
LLPAAHVADRVATLYYMQLRGIQVTYVDDPRNTVAGLLECRPTGWFAVPRVWEKLRAGIEARIAAEPDRTRRATMHTAVEVGRGPPSRRAGDRGARARPLSGGPGRRTPAR